MQESSESGSHFDWFGAMKRSFRTIFTAGTVAGLLDIGDAFVTYALRGVAPARVLQGIASGLLGIRAFTGGAWTVILGGGLHFLIAFSAAGVFYFASRRIQLLTKRPVFSGILYGCCVFSFMNFVVLPLSAIGLRLPSSPGAWINSVLAILLLVGLPISLIVHRIDVEFEDSASLIVPPQRGASAAGDWPSPN
jgi:hypothetical protein